MLSQTAEYALRAVVFLASSGAEPRTTQQIAKATRVRREYLSKVLQILRRAKLVAARPGQGGGFMLTRDANRVTVLDVVGAVDPLRRFTRCPLRLVSHEFELCPLHAQLDAAMHDVQAAFGRTTIANLLATPPSTTKRCPFPTQA